MKYVNAPLALLLCGILLGCAASDPERAQLKVTARSVWWTRDVFLANPTVLNAPRAEKANPPGGTGMQADLLDGRGRVVDHVRFGPVPMGADPVCGGLQFGAWVRMPFLGMGRYTVRLTGTDETIEPARFFRLPVHLVPRAFALILGVACFLPLRRRDRQARSRYVVLGAGILGLLLFSGAGLLPSSIHHAVYAMGVVLFCEALVFAVWSTLDAKKRRERLRYVALIHALVGGVCAVAAVRGELRASELVVFGSGLVFILTACFTPIPPLLFYGVLRRGGGSPALFGGLALGLAGSAALAWLLAGLLFDAPEMFVPALAVFASEVLFAALLLTASKNHTMNRIIFNFGNKWAIFNDENSQQLS